MQQSVRQRDMSKNFGNTERRQSCSQGSCWDPKKQGRMKHQKKKKERKHHPFLCLVTNSTFSVASPVLRLLLIHILPHSTFCLSLLPYRFFFSKAIWGFKPRKMGTGQRVRKPNRKTTRGFFFFTLLLVISNFLSPRFPYWLLLLLFSYFLTFYVFLECVWITTCF